MNTYFSTVEALRGKTKSELNAIFHKAACAASDARTNTKDRAAARQTAANAVEFRRKLTHEDPTCQF